MPLGIVRFDLSHHMIADGLQETPMVDFVSTLAPALARLAVAFECVQLVHFFDARQVRPSQIMVPSRNLPGSWRK